MQNQNKMTLKDVCRLCGKKNGVQLNIFDPVLAWLSKIEAVVPDVVILRNDSLSKVICHRCAGKVKEFYEFKDTCIRTQRELKERLPWMSSSSKDRGNILLHRTVSPIVSYMGGPLAYPFGNPEPTATKGHAVEVLTLSDDEESTVSNVSPRTSPPKLSHASVPIQPQGKIRAPVKKHLGSNSTPPVSNGLHWSGGMVQMPRPVNTMSQSMRVFAPTKAPIQSSQCVQAAASSSTSNRQFVSQSRTLPEETPTLPIPKPINSQFDSGMHPKPIISASSSVIRRIGSQDVPSVKPPASKRISLPFKPSPVINQQQISSTSFSSPIAVARGEPSTDVDRDINKSQRPRMPPGPLRIGFRNSNCSDRQGETVASQASTSNSFLKDSLNPVLNSSVRSAQSQRKAADARPKPKCKKRPITEITEANTKRIREMYPQIDAVKISEKTVIFPCTVCNTILMTEEAISAHKCSIAGNNENVAKNSDNHDQASNKESSLLLNQNEESNHSSSSIELISSDDETSNNNPAPKHLCSVCGKQFHNLPRLQKHISSCATGEQELLRKV